MDVLGAIVSKEVRILDEIIKPIGDLDDNIYLNITYELLGWV